MISYLGLVVAIFGAVVSTTGALIFVRVHDGEERRLAGVETKALGYRDDYEEYSSPDNVDKAWYEPSSGTACSICGMDDKAIVKWSGHNGYWRTDHRGCVWCRELICLTEHLKKYAKKDTSMYYLRDL